MARRRHSAAIAVAFIATLVIAPSASARDRGDTRGSAETRGQGVDIGAEGSAAGQAGRTARVGGRVGTDSHGQPCEYHTSKEPDPPVNFDGVRLVPLTDEPPSDPADQLYELWCNEEFVGFRWYGPGTPSPEVAAALERLLDRLDITATTVEARPEGAGLVGVPAYAWLAGNTQDPLTASLTLPGFGTTVTVVARLSGVVWDFGDGTAPLDAGAGAPWPEPSAVHHTYADPSTTDNPYAVTATVTYTPTYTVDGVPGGALAPVTFALTRGYAVRSLEAVRQR